MNNGFLTFVIGLLNLLVVELQYSIMGTSYVLETKIATVVGINSYVAPKK